VSLPQWLFLASSITRVFFSLPRRFGYCYGGSSLGVSWLTEVDGGGACGKGGQ